MTHNKEFLLYTDKPAPFKYFYLPVFVANLRKSKDGKYDADMLAFESDLGQPMAYASRVLPGQTRAEAVANDLRKDFNYEGDFQIRAQYFYDEAPDKHGKILPRIAVLITINTFPTDTLRPAGMKAHWSTDGFEPHPQPIHGGLQNPDKMSGFFMYYVGICYTKGMGITNRQQRIMTALLTGSSSLPQLMRQPTFAEVTERTLQRDINELIELGFVVRQGEARAVSYTVTPAGKIGLVLAEDQLEDILANEERVDLRYDFDRLQLLQATPLFTEKEQKLLDEYNFVFQEKLKTAPADIIRRERERITIELSWKSSQFEGNTYSLLETETLLKDGIPAKGKTQEETTMVLNHKKALDFSEQNREIFAKDLKVQTIIELHRLLAEDIISPGLRERLVGITGTVYKPLDNKFQIEEELSRLCDVINSKQSVYEKALLAFTYVCYLQPFNDGNKRTARILANAILYAHDSFPLSLRAVNVNTYKLAILAFYELGILGNAKQVFIGQAKFAAENYAI